MRIGEKLRAWLLKLLNAQPIPKSEDEPTDDPDDPDCGSGKALAANKCVSCCQSAYLRSVQILEPLEDVLNVLGFSTWEEVANDVSRLLGGGSGHWDSIKEEAAEDILRSAGYDVPTQTRVFQAQVITKIRPVRRNEFRPPGNMPREPVYLPNGTAQIYLDPGWSINPVPALQAMVKAAKKKVQTRTKTTDCCMCVAKKTWGQNAPRKKVRTVDGDIIRRRAPGGAPP